MHVPAYEETEVSARKMIMEILKKKCGDVEETDIKKLKGEK